jgi:omega-6 fatty acid desaturase (delta-12 desaturase)
VQPRLISRSAPQIRRSVIATNFALAALVAGLWWLVGWQEYLLVQMPSALLAATGATRTPRCAGSSHLKLPRLLQFFTGNIGLHHVQRLSTRVPNCNLQRAHDHNPIFHAVPTLSLWDGLRAVRSNSGTRTVGGW